MELKIDSNFEKHYNDYRSKEEASKTKKILKRQIKELEQSSSSDSDSDYNESHQQQFIAQCDRIINQIATKGMSILDQATPLFEEIVPTSSEVVCDRPVYAKDLNRKILITSGKDNETDLANIAQAAHLDSEALLQSTHIPELPTELIDVSDDEDFFRPSLNPRGPRFPIPESQPGPSELSEDDSDCSETLPEPIVVSGSIPIEINRDRRQATVRVSKTTSRAEKRAARKVVKQEEIRAKMKRLQAVHADEMRDRLTKALRHAPQLAGVLSIADVDDDDFNVDEWSAKLTRLYEEESGKLPEDLEKPVFSDDSDLEPPQPDELPSDDNGDSGDTEFEIDQKKRKKPAKKSKNIHKTGEIGKSIISTDRKTKKNREFFTNLELPESAGKERRANSGIVRRSGETEEFCRDKHRDFASYLKKNFDVLCEDLIRGKDESDDLLCKFRFRKVEKQDFGLDTEEIILADPKELNRWASLKKVVRLRTALEEQQDREKYSRDSVLAKKQQVLTSLYREESEQEPEAEPMEAADTEKNQLSKSTRKRQRKLANKKKLKEEIETGKGEENEIVVEKKKIEKVDEKKKKRKLDKIENDNQEGERQNKQVKIENPNEKSEDKEPEKMKLEENNVKDKKKKKSKKIEIESEQSKVESEDKNEQEKCGNGNDFVGVKKRRGEEVEIKQTKKHKSKKSKACSVPVLNANRLESLGIKPGYYKHVLMDDKQKQ